MRGDLIYLRLVRETGFEPARCVAPNAAKAFASPCSATPALLVTGRDRPRAPTTASPYFDSMLAGGGRAKTLGQRHAVSLAAIGLLFRGGRGQGVSSALAPNVSAISLCAGEFEGQRA